MEKSEYVTERANKSRNPILVARYNHLLWKSPQPIKHNKYANLAIEGYIEAIKTYVSQFQESQNEENLIRVGMLFESLVAIQNDHRTQLPRLKALVKQLLFESTLKNYALNGILEQMLKYPKLFKPQDFQGTLSIYENEISGELRNADNLILVNYHLPNAIRIATKLGVDVKTWHNEIGLAYLRMANDQVGEDRHWIKQRYYSDAIKSFQLAGNEISRKTVEKLYADLKPKIRLNKVEIPFSDELKGLIENYISHIRAVASEVLETSAEEVYRTISSGLFFPKFSDTEKASNSQSDAFLDFAYTIRFDSNTNISTEKGGPSKFTRNIFETYSYHFRFSALPYLQLTLYNGIISGKLTYENLISHLMNKTWIGKPSYTTDLSGAKKEVNWINLIAPSLYDFFVQTYASVNSSYYDPSYVLCCDSLTLKIEGLFRDFCGRVGVPTSRNSPKGMHEVNLSNILEDGLLENHFNDDDLLFFNFLFSSDGGMSLRNKIAHSFLGTDDYNLNHMLLMIAVLLRLGKYDYKPVPDDSND